MRAPTIIIASLAMTLMSSFAAADSYYKWVDDKGVTKYSEQPPSGIPSEKVNTYSGSSEKYDPSAAIAKTDEAKKEQAHMADMKDKAAKLEEEEKAKCAKVSEQRKVLSERGRVRLKDKDGTERVMTPEEQAAKIIELEKYEKEMCTTKK